MGTLYYDITKADIQGPRDRTHDGKTLSIDLILNKFMEFVVVLIF